MKMPAELINDARQILMNAAQRPAVKKTGERATLVSYAELTRMQQLLTQAVEQIADIDMTFLRPLGATPSHYGFTVERRKVGMFEIREGTAHRAICTSFEMVMAWFRDNEVPLDFKCVGFSLEAQPYKTIFADNS